MQGNQTMKLLRPDFLLQKTNFRFRRVFPEFPVEIFAASRTATARRHSGWITRRIDEESITLGHFGVADELLDKSDQRGHSGGLVSMDSRKEPEAHRIATARGAVKNEARKLQLCRIIVNLTERLAGQKLRSLS